MLGEKSGKLSLSVSLIREDSCRQMLSYIREGGRVGIERGQPVAWGGLG